jgi:reactive intermediate/imine deaminase
MIKEMIHTSKAPQAIGCYSQAIKAGNVVYLSGQIGFEPQTMELVAGMEQQTRQMFQNLEQVVIASGGNLAQIVKLTIYLTDMNNFAVLNQVMAEFFTAPFPARAAVGVKELPKGAIVEADAILVL